MPFVLKTKQGIVVLNLDLLCSVFLYLSKFMGLFYCIDYRFIPGRIDKTTTSNYFSQNVWVGISVLKGVTPNVHFVLELAASAQLSHTLFSCWIWRTPFLSISTYSATALMLRCRSFRMFLSIFLTFGSDFWTTGRPGCVSSSISSLPSLSLLNHSKLECETHCWPQASCNKL